MCKRMMLVVAALLLVAVSVQATVDPVAVGVYNASGIGLSQASPNWNANLTTYAAFTADVYRIGGYNGGTTYGKVVYEDNATEISNFGLSGPFVKLGFNDKGWTLYKFVLPVGQITGAGGTITANALRTNNGQDITGTWLGVNTSISGSSTVDIGGVATEAAFTKVHFPASGAWGSYGNLSLAIPTGVNEFYVALVQDWVSERFCYTGLNVSANVVAVPEPMTMLLLGLGGLGLIKRK